MLVRTFKKFQVTNASVTFQKSFLSNHRVTIGPLPSKPEEEILKPMSLETANQKQILHDKILKAVEQFKRTDGDTGSAAVQIAVMTERIQNLARHFAVNRKDFGSRRGYQLLVSRRRSMMKYLKEKDFEAFRKVVVGFNLTKEASELR